MKLFRTLAACGALLFVGAGCQTMNVKNDGDVARAVIVGLPDRDRPILIAVQPGATRTELIGGAGTYGAAVLDGTDREAVKVARTAIAFDLEALFLEEPAASIEAFHADLARYEKLLDDVLASPTKSCSMRIGEDEDGMAIVTKDVGISCFKRKTPDNGPAEKK